MKKYNPHEIELKWQRVWEEKETFHTSDNERFKKFYLLEMFPYPSGRLHMGHVRNYVIGDTYARFLRMNGYNVLYPMGYDALGLPAENAAIKNKVHPREWTEASIANMVVQQKRLGLSYDWTRLVVTSREEYYRWNQWIFLKFYERGMVERREAAINWCPSCETVLANEQVVQGKCWRCGTEVEIKTLKQWFVKITDYADELLEGLDKLNGWPERVRLMQKNWIGRNEGVIAKFNIEGRPEHIDIFTTRADTLFGVTFLSIAPEHPLLHRLIKGTPQETEIKKFVNRVAIQNRRTRTDTEKTKEGIFTGFYAIHPFTGDKVPIWVANFVLMEYGTGAIMAVPAHDQRDFEFAKKYDIPIKPVILPPGKTIRANEMKEAYVEDGVLADSGQFSGLDSATARPRIAENLNKLNLGGPSVQYKLRDWLISRQRYWGTPIPVIYCEHCGEVPVPEKDLPVRLPDDVTFTGRGNPLKTSPTFVHCTCPKCGGTATRETDTMDTFFDSSWYFIRYTSPHEEALPFDSRKVKKWLPVDQYIGGIEHAVMHLLYSRFFIRALRDISLIEIDEPFKNLLCQGMVIKDGFKMSKSRGNIVEPDEIIKKYGADTARLFILFASPPEKDLEWSDEGVEGCWRFLNRVWRLCTTAQSYPEKSDERESIRLKRAVNSTIYEVTHDIREEFHFNTAIARIMELVNELYIIRGKIAKMEWHGTLKTLVLLLSPFAPHIAEELWHSIGEGIGRGQLIASESWPEYNEKLLQDEQVDVVVQINGRLRSRIRVLCSAGQDEVLQIAMSDDVVKKHLSGLDVIRKVYVPGRLLNIVTRH